MSITKRLLKYSTVANYLKLACCAALASSLFTVYHYKVTVPYNKLEAKYNKLRHSCDKAPVECIQIGRDTIQSNMEERIKHNLERIHYEEPKVITDVNDTTFTFSF